MEKENEFFMLDLSTEGIAKFMDEINNPIDAENRLIAAEEYKSKIEQEIVDGN